MATTAYAPKPNPSPDFAFAVTTIITVATVIGVNIGIALIATYIAKHLISTLLYICIAHPLIVIITIIIVASTFAIRT
jgi:hypothetical protein